MSSPGGESTVVVDNTTAKPLTVTVFCSIELE